MPTPTGPAAGAETGTGAKAGIGTGAGAGRGRGAAAARGNQRVGELLAAAEAVRRVEGERAAEHRGHLRRIALTSQRRLLEADAAGVGDDPARSAKRWLSGEQLEGQRGQRELIGAGARRRAGEHLGRGIAGRRIALAVLAEVRQTDPVVTRKRVGDQHIAGPQIAVDQAAAVRAIQRPADPLGDQIDTALRHPLREALLHQRQDVDAVDIRAGDPQLPAIASGGHRAHQGGVADRRRGVQRVLNPPPKRGVGRGGQVEDLQRDRGATRRHRPVDVRAAAGSEDRLDRKASKFIPRGQRHERMLADHRRRRTDPGIRSAGHGRILPITATPSASFQGSCAIGATRGDRDA
nr:hypothetical protein [Mycolicibacterium fallax]